MGGMKRERERWGRKTGRDRLGNMLATLKHWKGHSRPILFALKRRKKGLRVEIRKRQSSAVQKDLQK